jgi:hypothetical protein
MNDVDIDELRKARFMSLMCPPTSPQAKALVNDIITIITQAEHRQRARKASDLAAFNSAVGLIVGDLLIASIREEPRWSYHPMSSSAFGERPVGYKTFKAIIGLMKIAGLIEIAVGRNTKVISFEKSAPPIYSPGLASRFKPTLALLSKGKNAGITKASVKAHFLQQLPKNVIEVRGQSANNRGVKIKGSKLKTRHNEKSREMEAELLELNKFLAGFDLEGASFSGYRRLFSNGDVDGFNFQWGGRIYGVGEHNYQLFSKEHRRNFKINGAEVVDVDLNASHLSILHGIHGFPLPDRDDIYAIDGIQREIVKAWITATLGHHGFHSRWPSKTLNELKNKGIVVTKSMTMKAFQPIILDYFPVLADWQSSLVRWADLMFIESEIVIGTALELMWSYAIPCYSVHDSIIVRKKDQSIAVKTLSEQFEMRTTILPKITIN